MHVVIPRLAKRAEGPHERSIATAKQQGHSGSERFIFREAQIAGERSLAVCAARDDPAFFPATSKLAAMRDQIRPVHRNQHNYRDPHRVLFRARPIKHAQSRGPS